MQRCWLLKGVQRGIASQGSKSDKDHRQQELVKWKFPHLPSVAVVVIIFIVSISIEIIIAISVKQAFQEHVKLVETISLRSDSSSVSPQRFPQLFALVQLSWARDPMPRIDFLDMQRQLWPLAEGSQKFETPRVPQAFV